MNDDFVEKNANHKINDFSWAFTESVTYYVFAILNIAYLYSILLLSVSCPVAVILLHCGASVTITNSSYV